jgi:acetolactate synthase-1/3 small subunit
MQRRNILRTFIIYVEDKPGVLNRTASLFRRRSFNIESLNVGQTHVPGVSRMTAVVEADEDTARRLEANLYKLLNVLEVQEITHQPRIERELALIKVRATAEQRADITRVAEVYRAHIVDMSPTTMVLELAASHDRIASLASVLAEYGIEEMVQTGSVAMSRGPGSPAAFLSRHGEV